MVELLPRWNIKVCSEVRIIFSNKKINHREISRILRDCKINITLARLKDDDILKKFYPRSGKSFYIGG